MTNEENDLLIKAVHEVAGNIRSLAQRADEGRAESVDVHDFINNSRYEILIMLLAQTGLATPDDTIGAPTEDLKRKADPVLSPVGLTITQIYADARKGAAFMMQQIWEAMKDAPEYPENPRPDYDLLHSCMTFLGTEPGSDDLCALLDTTPQKFKRIDKSFALACAYESLRSNQHLVRLFQEQQAQIQAVRPMGIGAHFAAARDFKQRYDEGAEQVFKDIAVLMRRSQIRHEEVKFYFLARLQQDGDVVLYADPREPLN
jgi:hypothetical protein